MPENAEDMGIPKKLCRHFSNIGIWDIEVFFKVCKSYLRLSKECHCLSFDAMTAHTAVVFTRYMMLSIENRESNDSQGA